MTKGMFVKAVLLATVASAFCSAPALAARTHSVERYYYSDETFTVEVGYSIATCNGGMHGYGQTPWYIEVREPCSGAGDGKTPPYYPPIGRN